MSRNHTPAKGDKSAAWFDRFSAIPGLLITWSISLTLLGLYTSDFRSSENVYEWVRDNRTFTSIAVQILSHVLGVIHVQVLCTVLRASFILSVGTRSFSIYAAQFVHAASTPRMTWTLPWRLYFPLLLLVIASFLPAAFWAGALTPLTTERNSTQIISIPSFEVTDPSRLWDGDTSTAVSGARQWMTNDGLFTFDPSSLRGPLLHSAAEASAVTDGQHIHSKLDKTGYSYLGRSYGTGASAGLIPLTDVNVLKWYSYQEPGFSSTVSCFFNDSIADSFRLTKVGGEPDDDWGGIIAKARGPGAFGGEDIIVDYYMPLISDSFAWGPAYDNVTKKISVQMITAATESTDPWAFWQFNNMQCDLSYSIDNFDIRIDNTSSKITSKARNESNEDWPIYGDRVLTEVWYWLYSLTYADTCIGGCQLGRALRLNANLLQNTTNQDASDTLLRATEDFLGAATDDILVNLISTRMISNAQQSTRSVEAVVGVPSVKFGSFTFIVVVAVLNILITIIYLVEALRTKAWARMPPFDLNSIGDVIIGAAKGGVLSAAATSTTTAVQQPTEVSSSNTNPFADQESLSSTVDLASQSHRDQSPPRLSHQKQKRTSSLLQAISRTTRVQLRYYDDDDDDDDQHHRTAQNSPALIPLLEEEGENQNDTSWTTTNSGATKRPSSLLPFRRNNKLQHHHHVSELPLIPLDLWEGRRNTLGEPPRR